MCVCVCVCVYVCVCVHPLTHVHNIQVFFPPVTKMHATYCALLHNALGTDSDVPDGRTNQHQMSTVCSLLAVVSLMFDVTLYAYMECMFTSTPVENIKEAIICFTAICNTGRRFTYMPPIQLIFPHKTVFLNSWFITQSRGHILFRFPFETCTPRMLDKMGFEKASFFKEQK